MKNKDKSIIGIVVIIALVLLFYYAPQFMIAHPYWSIFIGILLITGLAMLIKKSVKNQGLIEKEKTFLYFIFDSIKSIFSQSGKNIGEKKERIPITNDIKNSVFDRAGDKCQICGEDVSLNIHHIDGNPSNNSRNNLIVLCGVDHDKADKGVIPKWRLKNVINTQKTSGYISVSKPKN